MSAVAVAAAAAPITSLSQKEVVAAAKKKRNDKAKKILGMVAHPPPNLNKKEQVLFCTKKFDFAYSISHLCLLGFTFGYIDTNSFARFGLYVSLQTGNFVNSALRLNGVTSASTHAIDISMIVLCALCGVIIGPWFSCALLEYFDSRSKAYLVIMISLSPSR